MRQCRMTSCGGAALVAEYGNQCHPRLIIVVFAGRLTTHRKSQPAWRRAAQERHSRRLRYLPAAATLENLCRRHPGQRQRRLEHESRCASAVVRSPCREIGAVDVSIRIGVGRNIVLNRATTLVRDALSGKLQIEQLRVGQGVGVFRIKAGQHKFADARVSEVNHLARGDGASCAKLIDKVVLADDAGQSKRGHGNVLASKVKRFDYGPLKLARYCLRRHTDRRPD